jgi:hypothetical protein
MFEKFVTWFNRNLAGETIYTASRATVNRRINQFTHIKGLTADEDLALRFEVSNAIASAR